MVNDSARNAKMVNVKYSTDILMGCIIDSNRSACGIVLLVETLIGYILMRVVT